MHNIYSSDKKLSIIKGGALGPAISLLVAKHISKPVVAEVIAKIASILVIIIDKEVVKTKASFLVWGVIGIWLNNSSFNCGFNKSLNLGCNLAYLTFYYYH